MQASRRDSYHAALSSPCKCLPPPCQESSASGALGSFVLYYSGEFKSTAAASTIGPTIPLPPPLTSSLVHAPKKALHKKIRHTMDTHQSYPTWFQSDVSEERRRTPNWHVSNPAFHGTPLSARPSSTRVQSLSQMYSQPLAGQVHLDRGIGQDFSRLPMAINSHPVPHPIDDTPRGRELHMFPSDHITPTHAPEIPSQLPASVDLLIEQTPSQYLMGSSQGVHTRQSNCQTATLPQRPPLQFENFPTSSSTTIFPTHPVVPPERAYLTIPPSLYDRGSKETPADACPFPACHRRFGRTQDLERHVHKHLSRCVQCTQPNCSWTGRRHCALRDHYRKKHRGVPVPERETSMIYDARALVKLLLKKEITFGRAVCEARLLFRSKAAQVGKLDVWLE